MPEKEKKRLKEYQNVYREVRKSRYNNCDIIIINKIVFNYDFIKYAIYLYIIKPLYSYYFRQTGRKKSPIIHD